MFTSARLKLTAWYLLIIMSVSIGFSVAVYRILGAELDRVERMSQYRIERRLPDRVFIMRPDENGQTQVAQLIAFDHDLIEETKRRLAFILIAIDTGILLTSAILGYVLAGRTLDPIRVMVDEQNRFVTDASHELRTPLTSLKSEIEVNLRDTSLSASEARKLLKSNLEEVEKLTSLSDNLLRLMRYHGRQQQLPMERVTIADIASKSVATVSAMAKSKHIRIVNDTGDESVTANPAMLSELFVIFLDNAVKYSPEHSTVTLGSRRKDGRVQVTVADTGIGIAPEDIPHLFDRFYRTDKARTKQDAGGYGLGLSIAKQIAQRHNASITVHSEPDHGTRFSISFPEARA